MTEETAMQVNDAALRLLRADAWGGAMLLLKAIGIVLCVLLPDVYAHGDEGHGTLVILFH